MGPSSSVRIARQPDVLERRCGSVVLLLRRAGDREMRRLDGVTASTWLALAAPTPLQELVASAQLAASGAAAADDVAKAVTDAVRALERVGLVTVGRSPDADADPGRG